MEVQDITVEQQFSAQSGNIVYIVVKGLSIAPSFKVTATLITMRKTPYPVVAQNITTVTRVIVKNVTNITEEQKEKPPRMR
jgi:hypothetical protein